MPHFALHQSLMDLDYEGRDSDEEFQNFGESDEDIPLPDDSEEEEDDLINRARKRARVSSHTPTSRATRNSRVTRNPVVIETPKPSGWITASRRDDSDEEGFRITKKPKLADLADNRLHSLRRPTTQEHRIASIDEVQIISDDDSLEVIIDLSSDDELSNSTRRTTPQPSSSASALLGARALIPVDSPRTNSGDDSDGLVLDSDDDAPSKTSQTNSQHRRLKKSSQLIKEPVAQKPKAPKKTEAVRQKPKERVVTLNEDYDDAFDCDSDGGEDYENGEVKFSSVMEQASQVGAKLTKRLLRWHATWDASANGKSNGLLTNTNMDGMIPQPEAVLGKLKDYQVAGLNWLRILHLEGLNGILADEMGLGKTIQTISLLAWIHEMRQKYLEENSKKKKQTEAPQAQASKPEFDYLSFGEDHHDWPTLIVAPTSTIANWEREMETWAPSLRVLVFNGSLREREELKDEIKFHYKKHKEHYFDVMIAPYQTVGGKSDSSFFKHGIRFNYMVVDEAQMLKGKNTNRYTQLMQIRSVHRLLLTGTPLQNNLSELQALLAFLMPTIFGDLNNFSLTSKLAELQKQGKKVIESDYVTKLKKVLQHFILRRLKSQVGLGLLPKIHEVININPPEIQLAVAHQVVNTSSFMLRHSQSQSTPCIIDLDDDKSEISSSRKADDDSLSETTGSESARQKSAENDDSAIATPLANLLMQLRKAANHPIFLRSFYNESEIVEIATVMHERDPAKFGKFKVDDVADYLQPKSDYELHLITKQYPSALKHLHLTNEELFGSSGKLNALRELLPRLHSQGHRVVLFSQFTTVLDVLELFLQQDCLQHLGYRRMDGSTAQADRQVIMDEFNRNPDTYFIFLASTLAGGLGVNLTSADTVIFFDMSFNPQVDRQAEDRCHRLGQTKEVTVYNLLMPNSVESYMYEMATAKTELSGAILGEGKFAALKKQNSGSSSTQGKENSGVVGGKKKSKKEEENVQAEDAEDPLSGQSDKAIEKSFMHQIAIRMGIL